MIRTIIKAVILSVLVLLAAVGATALTAIVHTIRRDREQNKNKTK